MPEPSVHKKKDTPWVSACYLFVGSSPCALDIEIKFDRQNQGGPAPRELIDSLASGLAFLPRGLGNQNFLYEVKPRIGKRTGLLLGGKSAGLMTALHHRVAVAAGSNGSLAGTLSRVYATGELNGEQVTKVDLLHEKLELVLNAIDLAGGSGPFKFLVPADDSVDSQWLERCAKSSCPVPADAPNKQHAIHTRRGPLEILPVQTLRDAELAVLGTEGATILNQALRKAAGEAKRRLVSRLAAGGLFALLVLGCLVGYWSWSRNLTRIESVLQKLNSEQKWDDLDAELRRIEGRPDAADMYNFFKGRVLVYRRRQATNADAATYLNAVGSGSRFFIRAQKTLLFHYGRVFGTGSKEFGEELLKAADRLSTRGRSPLESYYRLAAEFANGRRPTWPTMEDHTSRFRRRYQDVFDFERMRFSLTASVGERIEFDVDFHSALEATVVFFLSASAQLARAEDHPMDAYLAVEDFAMLEGHSLDPGHLRLFVSSVGLHSFDQLIEPIRSVREWVASQVCRAGGSIPLSFSFTDQDGDSLRVQLSVENGGGGSFDAPTAGVLTGGQGAFVNSFRTKSPTNGTFVCVADDSRGGVTKVKRTFTVLPAREASKAAPSDPFRRGHTQGAKSKEPSLDLRSRVRPPLPTLAATQR